VSTLDQYFQVPKKEESTAIADRCANPRCRKVISCTETKYTLTIKGKDIVYCQGCAKKILQPQENSEENL
jgi:hypothetical protein